MSMKIVVIGGTGLIGSKVVEKLRAHGHEAVAAAPKTGLNTVTGEGLAEVLKGASVVVDGPVQNRKFFFRYHVPVITLAVTGPTALSIYAIAVWGLTADLVSRAHFRGRLDRCRIGWSGSGLRW